MRLATIQDGARTRAARVEGAEYVELDAPDVGALLAEPGWRERARAADGKRYGTGDVRLAPVTPNPGKIVCVGLNYRKHILEMGRELPEYPTLFAKFADTLIGAEDDILAPRESEAVDWEAELAIVLGATVRRADAESAAAAIAGFTVLNDVSMRDWQFRTREWLQGKNFESSTPIGPVLVTPDELPGEVRPRLAIGTEVNGERMQQAQTDDLVFDPVRLVQYVSTMVSLRPGDVVASGTPGGVGHARTPARYLRAGDRVVTEIENIGRLDNRVRADS
ncbi:fumarylacetoacetate hydrolase family protein [Sciscionella sediminilitoris]|uniref:fumarylacetoacetate hydrolase family protein n=1 Tax=Sciscionella sediminilitoris TaxID=1445613 RepID=UPI0004DEF1DF|nr:fumarylacetoacetate hydrolase family protein [Sciscionella sp. SE31]